VPSALTSVNADWALPCSSLPGDHDCPYVPVADRSLSHADRTPRLGAPGSRRLRPDLAVLLSAPIRGVGYGPCAPPLPPIGLTAAGLFAGGQVSSADSRVRSPVTLTCARCPAVRSALDAGPEAYDNPAGVWLGAFAASACRPRPVPGGSSPGGPSRAGAAVSPGGYGRYGLSVQGGVPVFSHAVRRGFRPCPPVKANSGAVCPATARPYGEKPDPGTGSRTASRECTTVTRISPT